MSESRYAVCSTGNSFTVEDRRTGKRISTHATWSAAERAQKQLSCTCDWDRPDTRQHSTDCPTRR